MDVNLIAILDANNVDLAGALYIDGHVRVYHGQQTKLRDAMFLRKNYA